MTSPAKKTLPEVLADILARERESVHTHIPARVVKVNTSGGNVRSVNVVPVIKAPPRVDENGDDVVEAYPVIQNVPVIQPGAGGFRATFPVAVGDTVLLAFSEASLQNWLTVGGDVEAGATTRHHLTDAVAILGLRDYAHALASSPTGHMTIGHDEGAHIAIDENEVRLGDNAATDDVALKSDLQALKSMLLSATDGAGYGSALKALLNASPFPVCATKVKAI